MNRGYPICLAAFMMLGFAPLYAQNVTLKECFPQSLSFADCLHQFERETGPGGRRDLVEPLTRLAAHSFLQRQFPETDQALNLAREVVRFNEGLFTRSQVPLLIMQAENFSNSGNWAEARKLQDHLIWLFRSKLAVPDQAMIDELQAISRLHMRGAALDEDAWRVHHFTRALYSNRLAIDSANTVWRENDGRKAELIHEQLRMLHTRAGHAMKQGLPLPAFSDRGLSPGSLVLNLSERLTLKDMRKAGNRYIERFRQLVDGEDSEALEKLGIAKLYEADWLLLFDGNADVTDIYNESRSLFERAGVSREAIVELMGQPLLQPGMGYFPSAAQILRARSIYANTGDRIPEAVSFASIGLRPFADLVSGGYDRSASVTGE